MHSGREYDIRKDIMGGNHNDEKRRIPDHF